MIPALKTDASPAEAIKAVLSFVLFPVCLQIEGLQERLKNKDGTIERKSKESQAAASEKRRLETESAELKDQLDTKERKISVLQKKVHNVEGGLLECLSVLNL